MFYELGIAHSKKQNVVLLTQDIEDVPFDLKSLRIILYKRTIAGAEKLKLELKNTIEYFIDQKDIPSQKIIRSQNLDLHLRNIASKYKLMVDLKAMSVFFNGIIVPSGKDGLQQRHKIFLFILARNPGKAMDANQIRKEIEKFGLDIYSEPDKNLRAQIRNALKRLPNKYPDKISPASIESFLKTERNYGTRMDLTPNEIFTIYGNEEYP